MEQQRILLINFKANLARSISDILEENTFEVSIVDSLVKVKQMHSKNFLHNPCRLLKLRSLL